MVHSTRTIRTLTVSLILAAPLVCYAGPPLICQPFRTGAAELLPWSGGSSWNSPDPRYDVQRLTADTMRLLAPNVPVLARMENMRRATIYAARDARIASELMAAILARALTSAGTSSPDAQALFDAGYLIESYKQAVAIHRDGMLRPGDHDAWSHRDHLGSDGYRLVTRAIALSGGSAEMEFAASLMKDGRAADDHRRRAAAGALQGSLLAQNLRH
jgi:hypothetical protein